MPTRSTSGTQSATLGTEHTLATLSTLKVYQVGVDVAALADPLDQVEIRLKQKLGIFAQPPKAERKRQGLSAVHHHHQGAR